MARSVRWVGDPSPWNDPVIFKGIMTQRLPMDWVAKLMEFERYQRICALPDKSTLSLGPNHGFGRTYVWGPKRFVVEMEDEDATKLFANEWDKWQFLDVTDEPSRTERSPLGHAGWKALIKSFSKLSRKRRLLPQYR